MPIKPKYTSGTKEKIQTAERKFTDREEFIRFFNEALENNQNNEQNILVFYGVGGIGKSSLRKHLSKTVQDVRKDVITASLDFDIPSYRQEETALYHLRKTLTAKYKVQFPSFEIAYTVYWQKTHPQINLTKESFAMLDDSELLTDLLAILGEIPLVSLVPNLAKVTIKGKKMFKNWWVKRGQRELYNLPELEAKDILERLPMYFASDLKDYLENSKKECVFFIDTYEALWENTQNEGGFFMRDEWLRELIAQLPEPLWVICGREKLRWDEIDKEWEQYTEQHLVGGLSRTDAGMFLNSCGIADKNVRNIITKSSNGVPHYLDLAIDTYFEIKNRHGREPQAEDFARTQREVLDRFLRYLDKSEIETLKVLSAARTWNNEIFKLLISVFNTGYPLTAIDNISRFSFVQTYKDDKTFTIHDLMNKGLYERLNPGVRKEVHKCLFNYYNEKLENIDIKDISDEQSNAFTEAFYHGKNTIEFDEFNKWYNEKAEKFDHAAKWNLLIPIVEEMRTLAANKQGAESADYANLTGSLANLYKEIGLTIEFTQLIKEAISIYESIETYNLPEYIQAAGNLALVYKENGEYSKAVDLMNDLINKLKEKNDYYTAHCYRLMDSLALIYSDMGEYNKAIEATEESINIQKHINGENNPDYIISISNLAAIYSSKLKYDKAIELFKTASDMIINKLGVKHPLYSSTLNNLANIYTDTGRYDKAVEMYERCVDIDKKVYNQDNLSLAIDLANLANAYSRQGNNDKAIGLITESLKIIEDIFGVQHLNYAKVLSISASIYINKGEYDGAIVQCEKSISIIKNTVGDNHPAFPRLLGYLAKALSKKGDYEKANEIYRNIMEKIFLHFKKNNPLVINTLEDMSENYNKWGKPKEAKETEKQIEEIKNSKI